MLSGTINQKRLSTGTLVSVAVIVQTVVVIMSLGPTLPLHILYLGMALTCLGFIFIYKFVLGGNVLWEQKST